MKSAITDIFLMYGENAGTIDKGVNYRDIDAKLNELCEEFKKGLSKEQIVAFGKIRNMHDELQAATEEAHFKNGFKTGLKIATEAFFE